MSRNNKLGKVKKVHWFSKLKIFSQNFASPIFSNSARFFSKPRVSKKSVLKFIVIIFILVGINTTFARFQDEISRFRTEAFSAATKGNSKITTDLTVADVLGVEATSEKKSINLTNKFVTKDIRAYVFDEYFKKYNSPLYGHGQDFVDACEKYGMVRDCIGMVAIAMHETTLCTYYLSGEMHNCWGWGGGGEYRKRFDSFEQSIDEVTRATMYGYGNEFFTDFRNGQDYFCGPQAECQGWGYRVNNIAQRIDDFAESLGVGRLTNLR